MRSLRYLNTVLTVIAVLLTLNLWTLWTVTPGGEAMSMSHNAQAQGTTVPASQRQQMIDELKQLNGKVGDLQTLLKSGEVRAKVEMPSDKKDK